jgi:hypothetical protein
VVAIVLLFLAWLVAFTIPASLNRRLLREAPAPAWKTRRPGRRLSEHQGRENNIGDMG